MGWLRVLNGCLAIVGKGERVHHSQSETKQRKD